MTNRVFLVLFLVFAGFTTTPFACAPHVVDAVDPEADTGGSGGSSGSESTGGSGAGGEGETGGSTTGGNGGRGGSDVRGGTSGTGTTCPDGGSEDGGSEDRDGDGYPDCADGCPDDANKLAGGLCGCGLPDVAETGGVTCADLVALLTHRYAFNGTGTDVVDSASGGDADGDVVNTELTGTGALELAGVDSDQYVGLPNRLLSTRPAGAPATGSMTLEAWVRWTGGAAWQRIFDFGDNNGPREGEQGPGGVSYLFLTTRTPNAMPAMGAPQTGKMRVSYKRPGGAEWEVTLDAEIAMPPDVDTHVAVVVDGAQKRMSFFIDGVLQNGTAHFRNVGDLTFTSMRGSYDWSAPVPNADGLMIQPPAIDLTVVNDINNWLGRSQFIGDAEFEGTYYEFRIYGGALTPELIDISHRGGPDAEFLQ